MRTVPSLSVVLAFALTASCGGAAGSSLLGGDGGGSNDSGAHDVATQDVGHLPDAGHDVGALDTGMPDVGEKDSGVPKDTGAPDTAPSLPPISCGGADCPLPGSDCCVDTQGGGGPSYSCQTPAKPGDCMATGNTPVACAGADDCPGGVCCGMLNNFDTGYVSVACAPTCDSPQIVFCDPKAAVDECASSGMTCQMSSLLPGFSVCR